MCAYWKPPEAKPGQKVYTIDLPGLSEIFKIPLSPLQNKELKRERIKRMITHVSTVPESLKWIPPVITKLDDAQDILTTALWLGKPLLRKLPSKFIPFVGWALLASDIVNTINFLLGSAMTPGLQKPELHKRYRNVKLSKGRATLRAIEFFRPAGWRRKLGDVLQAAQASETITGIGLTLGSIMGCMSELFWAPFRIAQGARVEVRLPPENDLATKAYRFVGQMPQTHHAHEILSPDDHALLLAAHNIAVGAIMAEGIPINDGRINEMMSSQFPVMIPWEPSSIEALQEEGFDLSRENYYKAYIPKDKPTFADAIDLALSVAPAYEAALRTELGEGEAGCLMWQVYRETGMDSLSHLTRLPEYEFVTYSPEQRAALKLSEYNFTLTPPFSQMDLEELMVVAMAVAENRGRVYPDLSDFVQAANALGLPWRKKY